jgi:hypothetical protein
MSYIPKLPPGTLILQLVECHFPYITRETFSNVSSVPLESLILKNNSMETIEQELNIQVHRVSKILDVNITLPF